MLDVLRANAKSVLTYVLFGIIIVVFVVSFGPGSRGCGETTGESYAAKVNGATVTTGELEQHYAQLLRLYQQRAGQGFTRELAEQLGLRSQALDQLVDRRLVLQDAEKHGVRVTNEDLEKEVKSISSFQTNGRFDHELYTRTTTNTYGSPAHFEAQLREDLVYQRMMALLRQAVKVSEEEVKEGWNQQNDKVDLELVRVPLEAARKEVKVSPEEVKTFAQANASRIEARYNEQPDRWDRKRRVHARHILVRAGETAPPDADAAARKKVEAAAERVKKGEDFAKVAKEISEDPGTRENGGDLGFFGPGIMAKPFEDAANALKPGQVSGPVRTRFGWHVIKVEAVQEPEKVTLDEARDEIAREMLLDERARKLATAKAEEVLAKAKTGKTLAELFPPADDKGVGKDAKDKKAAPKTKTQAGGLEVGGERLAAEETGPFSASGDFVPRAGAVPGLVADALAASAGALLPKVYEIQTGGAVVARVKERQKPDPAKFTAERDEFLGRLRAQKETVVQQAWMKGLREKASIDVNRAALASARGAEQ